MLRCIHHGERIASVVKAEFVMAGSTRLGVGHMGWRIDLRSAPRGLNQRASLLSR